MGRSVHVPRDALVTAYFAGGSEDEYYGTDYTFTLERIQEWAAQYADTQYELYYALLPSRHHQEENVIIRNDFVEIVLCNYMCLYSISICPVGEDLIAEQVCCDSMHESFLTTFNKLRKIGIMSNGVSIFEEV